MNFSKDLLNLSVEGVVELIGGKGLDKICHVHVLNVSEDGVGL